MKNQNEQPTQERKGVTLSAEQLRILNDCYKTSEQGEKITTIYFESLYEQMRVIYSLLKVGEMAIWNIEDEEVKDGVMSSKEALANYLSLCKQIVPVVESFGISQVIKKVKS